MTVSLLCLQIANTSLSACLVVTAEDQTLSLQTEQFDPRPVYHKIMQNDVTCSHNEHENKLGQTKNKEEFFVYTLIMS